MPITSVVTNQCDAMVAQAIAARLVNGNVALFALTTAIVGNETFLYSAVEPYINRGFKTTTLWPSTGYGQFTTASGIQYTELLSDNWIVHNTTGGTLTPVGFALLDDTAAILLGWILDPTLSPVPAGGSVEVSAQWWFSGRGSFDP